MGRRWQRAEGPGRPLSARKGVYKARAGTGAAQAKRTVARPSAPPCPPGKDERPVRRGRAKRKATRTAEPPMRARGPQPDPRATSANQPGPKATAGKAAEGGIRTTPKKSGTLTAASATAPGRVGASGPQSHDTKAAPAPLNRAKRAVEPPQKPPSSTPTRGNAAKAGSWPDSQDATVFRSTNKQAAKRRVKRAEGTPSRESLAPGVRRRPRQMRERWKVAGASPTPPATESPGESHHAQKELYAGPPEGPSQLLQIRPPPRPTRRRGTRPARSARGRRWQARGRAPQPSTARSGPQSRRRARRPRVRRPARHGPTAIPPCRQRARPGPRATAAISATRRARPTSLAAQARRGGQSRPQ